MSHLHGNSTPCYNNFLMSSYVNDGSPTFRKLFPEYLEKYEEQQQQLSEQHCPKESPGGVKQEESSRPLLEKVAKVDEENNGVQEDRKDVKNQRRQSSIPTWVLLLLFSTFGIIMALPLLQLG